MKMIYKYLLIISVLLMLVPFLITEYLYIRLISVLLGIFLFTLGCIKKAQKKLTMLLILPIGLLVLTYTIDAVLNQYVARAPIFASKEASSKDVVIYNSLFYRVFACGNDLTYDFGYHKQFVCSNDTLDIIDINDFLENPSVSFKENKNKFIKLRGKISAVIGNSQILMETYTGNIELNGYVKFNKDIAVKLIDLTINHEDYYIYDELEVIGQVSRIEDNTIVLSNVTILENHLYDNYEVLVTYDNIYNEKMLDTSLYYLGIKDIYYRYDENNIYELSYLLSDQRESIASIVKGIVPSKVTSEGDLLYKLNKFNVLMCKNENNYIINKSINYFENIC